MLRNKKIYKGHAEHSVVPVRKTIMGHVCCPKGTLNLGDSCLKSTSLTRWLEQDPMFPLLISERIKLHWNVRLFPWGSFSSSEARSRIYLCFGTIEVILVSGLGTAEVVAPVRVWGTIWSGSNLNLRQSLCSKLLSSLCTLPGIEFCTTTLFTLEG